MERQLIVFSAPWCGPCKMYKPILDEVKDSLNIDITQYNVDEDAEMVSKYGVRGVPTTVLVKEDGSISSQVGAMTKGKLIAWLEK